MSASRERSQPDRKSYSPTNRPATSTPNQTDVMNMICAFARDLDQTIVLVTHDDNMAQYADRIVTLLDGRIIDDRLMNNA